MVSFAHHRAALPLVLALCALACAAPVVKPPPPILPPLLTAEGLDGAPVPLWHRGSTGETMLFVRGLTNHDSRSHAQAAARELVSHCAPALQVIVLIEPGAATLWPGFRARGDKELGDARARRASCLRQTLPVADAGAAASEQVEVVLDRHGDLRRELLGTADPGDDVALAAFAADGRAVYRAGVPADVGAAQAAAIVSAALAAARSGRPAARAHVASGVNGYDE